MSELTFKKLYDSEGIFVGLQIAQGVDQIIISLASSDLDSTSHSYKWDNLKRIIDKMAVQVQNELTEY